MPFIISPASPVPGSVRLACEWNTTALDVKGMKNTNNKAWLVEAPQVGFALLVSSFHFHMRVQVQESRPQGTGRPRKPCMQPIMICHPEGYPACSPCFLLAPLSCPSFTQWLEYPFLQSMAVVLQGVKSHGLKMLNRRLKVQQTGGRPP